MAKSKIALHDEKVINSIYEADDFEVVIHPEFKDGVEKNEMLMFVKPEVFLSKDQDKVANALKMIDDKLQEFEVKVVGLISFTGPFLGKKEIMNRHYGFINEMSRRASELVTDDDLLQISQKLSRDVLRNEIRGGHELLQEYSGISTEQLDSIWFEGESTKVRSGFYVRHVDYAGKTFIWVNAFHPQQLAHFTNDGRRLLAMLVRSNAPWDVLRNEMIGDTFPERASPGSIRGTLFRMANEFGFDEVTIGNNAVHLSAGPVEAVSEIHNFLGNSLELDITADEHHPNLIRQLRSRGLEKEEALEILSNPRIDWDGVLNDVHSITEHKDTDYVVDLWHKIKKVT